MRLRAKLAVILCGETKPKGAICRVLSEDEKAKFIEKCSKNPNVVDALRNMTAVEFDDGNKCFVDRDGFDEVAEEAASKGTK